MVMALCMQTLAFVLCGINCGGYREIRAVIRAIRDTGITDHTDKRRMARILKDSPLFAGGYNDIEE